MGVILVPFAGEGSGQEELTWGQQHVWDEMQASGSSLNMAATRELAPGTSIEDLVEELRFCLTRYESMRTRLVLVDGRPPPTTSTSGRSGWASWRRRAGPPTW